MTSLLEQEVKFRLESADAGRALVRGLRLELERERHFESNALFDFPDRSLTARDEALRIRRVGDEAWMTWKGPSAGGEVKSRVELESRIDDADAVAGTLEAIGLTECFRYEKYRSSYRSADAVLTLDETPIGVFLEIEGPPESIRAHASRLGLDMAAALTESYPALYRAHRVEQPGAPEFMVFETSA